MYQNPLLVISPMAGLTDAPFRAMALQCGASYGVSEMLTSQTSLWHTRKTQHRLKNHLANTPRIIQIAGANPELITASIQACSNFALDAIEINLGCPVKKVCNVLAGSALLRDELLVAKILTAAVNASNIPIYLKTRLGWDHQHKNILNIAQMAQDVGVKSLCIHGRTRSDMYNGYANYDLIAEVKQRLVIPVFANGDITTPLKAKQVLAYTKADGLYIGRAALGQPWLFQQMRDYLTARVNFEYSLADKLALIIKHITLIHQHYGAKQSIGFARKHFKWYLQREPTLVYNASAVFVEFTQALTTAAQLDLLHTWYESLLI